MFKFFMVIRLFIAKSLAEEIKCAYPMNNPEPVDILHSTKQLQHNLARSALRKSIPSHQVLNQFSSTRQLHDEVVFIESRIVVIQLQNITVVQFMTNLEN